MKFKKAVIAVRLSYGKVCATRGLDRNIIVGMFFEPPYIVFKNKIGDGDWGPGGLIMDLVEADDWKVVEL
ncbi:MAG: hypothetical protein NTZ28_13065 [Nitrospirae bacterium]|nr:hypothetical protein [Nitrospirota bacterium]